MFESSEEPFEGFTAGYGIAQSLDQHRFAGDTRQSLLPDGEEAGDDGGQDRLALGGAGLGALPGRRPQGSRAPPSFSPFRWRLANCPRHGVHTTFAYYLPNTWRAGGGHCGRPCTRLVVGRVTINLKDAAIDPLMPEHIVPGAAVVEAVGDHRLGISAKIHDAF